VRRSNFLAKFFLLFTNVFSVIFAFTLAYLIRFNSFALNNLAEQSYDTLLAFSVLICIIVSVRDKLFTEFESISLKKIFITVLQDVLTIIIGVFILIVALKGYQYSRQFHLLFSAVLFFSFILTRLSLFGALQSYYSKKNKEKRILLVATKQAKKVLLPLKENRELLAKVNSKVYLIDSTETQEEGSLVYLPLLHLDSALDESIDELVLFFSDEFRMEFTRLIELAEENGTRVRIVPNFSVVGSLDLVLEQEYGLPLLRIRPEPLEDVNNYLLKRVFDISFSLLFLLLIFPFVLLLIAPLIKLSSRGPVFFKQKRTGQLNHEFFCKKFRTMAVNSSSDEIQATKNDARITWIGKIMRKTNIDEFPQFWNVLVGDMSVCGPRPHMLKHTEEYSKIISKYKVRHFCKPGITGWAQVNGYRGETSDPKLMSKRVEFDIWYIENWSFWLDIKIVFKTGFNMIVGQEEAY
jgi:Undecaprenyl-phosphate glucose phosphotransferase